MEQEQKQQQQQAVELPHEYLIEGVKKAVDEIKASMEDARKKYGPRYNKKNRFEEFKRRFGLDDPERIWKEFDLVGNKSSREPAVVRDVLKDIGAYARNHAASRFFQEQQEKEAEKKENKKETKKG